MTRVFTTAVSCDKSLPESTSFDGGTVGYQKSPDSLFFKALNRIISLSRDQKIMKRSLLDSP